MILQNWKCVRGCVIPIAPEQNLRAYSVTGQVFGHPTKPDGTVIYCHPAASKGNLIFLGNLAESKLAMESPEKSIELGEPDANWLAQFPSADKTYLSYLPEYTLGMDLTMRRARALLDERPPKRPRAVLDLPPSRPPRQRL